MAITRPDSVTLLRRWRAGDNQALDELLQRHLPWIQEQVRRRLGPELRKKADSMDFVQDAVAELLRYGPRFEVREDTKFRALMVRIVENTIRDRHGWFTARRRDAARERPLPPDSVLQLGSAPSHRTPSRLADQREKECWIRLGIELLSPADRKVIVLRDWDGLEFAAVGEALDCSPEGARKRYKRALARLARTVAALRRGDTPGALSHTACA